MKPRVCIVREVAHGTAGYTHTFTSYQVYRPDGLMIHRGWDWDEAMHRANAEAKRAAMRVWEPLFGFPGATTDLFSNTPAAPSTR